MLVDYNKFILSNIKICVYAYIYINILYLCTFINYILGTLLKLFKNITFFKTLL